MGPRAGYLTPRGLCFLINMMGKPYQVIGLLNRIIGRKIKQAVSFTFSLLEETQNLKKKKKRKKRNFLSSDFYTNYQAPFALV